MKSSFYHIQINIDFKKNGQFYKDMMEFLGWSVIFGGDDMIGYRSEKSGDLWFVDKDNDHKNDYDGAGVNHIGIRVEKQNDIDDFVNNFMKPQNIEALFGTPQHREDFAATEDETYYQVMFKTADNILFEIVYIGKKMRNEELRMRNK